jgi:prepilin-type N-terminal cleavage/methylation domain-containing protein
LKPNTHRKRGSPEVAKYSIPSTKSGFTLIELLITIVLVSVGLIGVISFFNASLQSQFDAKNELIAAGLAQEGAELMRNFAEYKKLNGSDWSAIKTSLAACTRIDYRSLTGYTCNNGTNNYVCFSGGRYQQCASGTGIDMQRILTVTNNGVDGLYIKSEVTWNGRTTKAEDRLYENEY